MGGMEGHVSAHIDAFRRLRLTLSALEKLELSLPLTLTKQYLFSGSGGHKGDPMRAEKEREDARIDSLSMVGAQDARRGEGRMSW